MKTVLFVATVSDFMHFEINDMKILQDRGYQVEVACNIDDYNGFLEPLGVVIHDIPFARSPFSGTNVKAYKLLEELIRNGHYDFIHCHTPVGGVLTRMINFFRKRDYKLIYTAHGFHFYKGSPIINWLLFYPIEWLLSFNTDILITITHEDYLRAKSHFHAKKIEYIPGVGVDLNRFNDNGYRRVDRTEYRKRLGVDSDSFLLLSVGELNDNKNHESIIKALALSDDDKISYVIAGEGDKHEYLQNLIEELNLSERVKLLGQRDDIPALLSVSDLFCHPSFREGLSVAVMEAMSVSLPIICSEIRGNVDLISTIDEFNPLFRPTDIERIKELIVGLKNNKDVLEKLGNSNSSNVESFSLDIVSSRMKEIYDSI